MVIKGYPYGDYHIRMPFTAFRFSTDKTLLCMSEWVCVLFVPAGPKEMICGAAHPTSKNSHAVKERNAIWASTSYKKAHAYYPDDDAISIVHTSHRRNLGVQSSCFLSVWYMRWIIPSSSRSSRYSSLFLCSALASCIGHSFYSLSLRSAHWRHAASFRSSGPAA